MYSKFSGFFQELGEIFLLLFIEDRIWSVIEVNVSNNYKQEIIEIIIKLLAIGHGIQSRKDRNAFLKGVHHMAEL